MKKKQLKKEEYIGKGKHLNIARRTVPDFPLHAHDYFELEIILEGCGIHQLNGQNYPLARGSAYLISPADFHKVLIQKPLKLWNITFDETLLSPIQTETVLLNQDPCYFLNEQTLLKADTAAGLLEIEQQTGGHIQPLMDYILALVLRDTPPSGELSPIRKAMIFVQTHFRENPPLAAAAEQAGLCPVYFGTLFQKTVGQTYTQYVNACRVRCAQQLLADDLSVTEACFSSGFGSLSNFLQVFRRATGVSPQEYKAKIKKDRPDNQSFL